MKQSNRHVRILGNIVTGILTLLVILMTISFVSMKVTGRPPTILGHQAFIVTSGSMEPTFHTGSLVFARPIPSSEIKAGDIITYQGQGESKSLITHRVTAVETTEAGIEFITKGDANEVNDPMPVSAMKVVGRINLAIPYIGYFFSFSQSGEGRRILILIVAAGLFVVGINSLFKSLKAAMDEKKRKTVLKKAIDESGNEGEG